MRIDILLLEVYVAVSCETFMAKIKWLCCLE